MNQKVHFSSFIDNRKEIEYTIQSTIYVHNYVCVCVCVTINNYICNNFM